MKTQHILIDFENVQPASLALLKGRPVHIYVFVGASQTKLPFELAQSIQELGEAASYVKIEGNGKNALDFHIAYFLGELAKTNPDDYFHIVSKDTGYDPLIDFLKKQRKIMVRRSADLHEIPFLKRALCKTIDEKIELVIDKLNRSSAALPSKDQSLRNTINSVFQMQLAAQELDAIVKRLQSSNHIRITEGKVSYPNFLSNELTTPSGNN